MGAANPPAFPTDDYYDERRYGQQPGMTLRDYFAAQAIHVSAASIAAGLAQGLKVTWTNETVAREAYALADAMLKAREET